MRKAAALQKTNPNADGSSKPLPTREELENPVYVKAMFEEFAREKRKGKSVLDCLALVKEDGIHLESELPRGGFYERHVELD